MMKYVKWVITGFGFIIILVLLAVLGAQSYLNTKQVRQRIQAKVNQTIPGTVTWQQHRFSVFSGKLELKHVLLTGPEDNKLMELDRFSIRISWTGLLKGELMVQDLLLEKPTLFLATDRSGNLNLIQALYTPGKKLSETGKNGGLPFNILLRQLNVINGFVQYRSAEETAKNQTDHAVFQNVGLTITDGNFLKQSVRLDCQISGVKIQRRNIHTAIDQLSVKAKLHKNRIYVTLFDVNTDGLYAGITGMIENPFTSRPILDLCLKSRAFLSKIKKLTAIGSDFSGAVQVNSSLKGTLDDPDIDLILDYEGGKLAGKRIGRIHLGTRLEEKILNIHDTNLNTPLGKFTVNGNVDLKKAFAKGILTSNPDLDAIAYKLSIHQKDFSLESMSPKIYDLGGLVNADINVEGKGVDPNRLWSKTEFELNIKKLSAGKSRPLLDVHMTTQAGMEKGRVMIENLTVKTGASQLDMNGHYNVFSHQLKARFELKTPDLTQILTSLGINRVLGRMNLKGDVSGTVNHPVMNVRLNGDNLAYENIRFGEADVNMRFSNGCLSLDHGKLLNGNSIIDISGFARIVDPRNGQFITNPDFDVVIKKGSLFLEDFFQEMTGHFVLNGRLAGSVAHPKGQLDVNGKNVDFNIQKFSEINLSTVIDGYKIRINPLSIVLAPDEKIVASGWVSMDQNYEFSMVSNGISLKNIKKMASWGIDKGKISVDITGKGRFENPRFKGKAVVSDLMVKHQRLEKIPFDIEIKDQTVSITGRHYFILDASYGLQTRSFSASARFDQTDLTPCLHLIGKKELTGAITGSIESKGFLGTPQRIDAATRIDQLEILWKNTALIKGSHVTLSLHDDDISIPGMRLSLTDQGYLNIKGSGKLNKALHLEADGKIPFEILPKFTDVFSDASGDVRFSLTMNGNLAKPDVIIHADIKDGGMTIPGLFQKLHNINGNIRATDNTVVIDNIKGMLDTGKFELNGIIDHDRFQLSNFSLTVKGDNLPISIPDVLEIRLSSVLDIQGSPEKSLIKGDIELIKGVYDKDIRLNFMENIGQRSRKEPLVTSKPPWPVFNHTMLDCNIRHREPFIIDNNLALLSIKPDLHIQGTVNQPLISGRAEVESGTIYFQRNEFNVKKGVLDFVNPYKIEPTIDIESEIIVRQWTISLKISGTPDTLRFDMTSNPPEREEDILSLLISGKTTQELVEKEGGSSLSPKQMLADVLSETVQKEIKDATGLDVVVLEYNEAKDAESTDEVKVTVGKELSRRATIKYDVKAKNAKVVQKVITEYKLLERLLINAFQDTEGHYGGGIQFRLEFR